MEKGRFRGDRRFYRSVLRIAVPIMVQGFFTNLVNLLDNLMVGRVSTVEMTGVAVANRFIFITNLLFFGVYSGAGIFGAQFYGSRDREGLKNCFRFKLVFGGLAALLCILVLYFGGDALVDLYLKGKGDAQDIIGTHRVARQYLNISLIGLIPYNISCSLASSLRETGKTKPPMRASVAAVLTNLVLNTVLIFGLCGFKPLGAVGAAIATVISRFVELGLLCLWSGRHLQEVEFLQGLWVRFRIPGSLVKKILLKGLPVAVNELAWATGVAAIDQCYSLRGLTVVSALNIVSVFSNLMEVAFVSLGNATGIMLGERLGAGELERAKEEARWFRSLAFVIGLVTGAVFALLAGRIPLLYKTEPEVRSMATSMILMVSLAFPLLAFWHNCYYILRSGGNVVLTALADSGFVCLFQYPLALALVHFTALPILPLFAVIQAVTLIRAAIGGILAEKGVWVNRLVGPDEKE